MYNVQSSCLINIFVFDTNLKKVDGGCIFIYLSGYLGGKGLGTKSTFIYNEFDEMGIHNMFE